MGINATYKDGKTEIKNAYIKVGRIWGSKSEGWNCWVEVFSHEGDKETVVPIFSVSTKYIEDANPFSLLYEEISKLPFIVNEPIKENIVLEVKPKKKSRVAR